MEIPVSQEIPALRQGPISGLAAIGWILLAFGAAAIGSLAGPDEWYFALEKPAWTPPSWVFASAWTFLYLAMGIAAWRIWRNGGWPAQSNPLFLFLVQLALNAAWSPLFFGLRRIDLALVEVLLLWFVVGLTAARFLLIDLIAGLIFLVYLAWLSFAAFLNYMLWTLNS